MKHVPSRHCRKSGFTLIELLIVIAIIAILASILFPVFARARENARRSSCQSNLKQIGLGIMQYVQDYDERFPGQGSPPATLGIMDSIYPYTKSTQILQCPSEPTGPKDPSKSYEYSFFTTQDTDYYSNANLWVGLTDSMGKIGVHQAELAGPEKTVISGDGVSQQDDNSKSFECRYRVPNPNLSPTRVSTWAGFPHCAQNGPPTDPPDMPASKRHLEGANYLFGDGHVKWLRPEKIFSGVQETPASTGVGSVNNLGSYQATFLIK